MSVICTLGTSSYDGLQWSESFSAVSTLNTSESYDYMTQTNHV